MSRIAILVLIFGLCRFSKCRQEMQPVVKTTSGKIRGTIEATPNTVFECYRGIPYAKPPLGPLRFQSPEKAKPWKGVKYCQKYGAACPQIDNTNNTIVGAEDCLTLNVFTKSNVGFAPIFVFFHGGAYVSGSSEKYDPTYLMAKNIVVVTVNSRLGVFGYFSTLDENANGNVGLKDQIAALEWVQKNIKKFGGNPKKVTIGGESTGASSVALLQLSKRTKGLFHQIIGESGSALNPRYLQRNPLYYAHQLANYFNLKVNSSRELVKELQKMEFNCILRAAQSIQKINLKAGPYFPVIETPNKDAIITEAPYQLLASGNFNKIPFIFGYNTNEGSLGLDILNTTELRKAYDGNFELYYTKSFNNPKQRSEIGAIIHRHFMGNCSVKDLPKFTSWMGQELIVRGLRKSIDFQRKASKGYFYRFSYKGKNTIPFPGVGHGEEMQYLFKMSKLNGKDAKLSQRLIKLWTNFIIFGSPTPTPKDTLLQKVSWEECGKDNNSLKFLDIGTNLVKGNNPDEAVYKFWLKMIAKFAIPPLLTY